jgi:hypothetical protein
MELAPTTGFGPPALAGRPQPFGQAATWQRMPLGEAVAGKPDAGNPPVRFDEGGGGCACMADGYCATNGETLKRK